MNGRSRLRAAENSEALAWREVAPGTRARLLERITLPAFRQTRIVWLEPGASLVFSPEGAQGGRDVLVLDGSLRDESMDHPAGTYLAFPAGDRPQLVSPRGCRLFIKSRPSVRRRRVVVATKTARWESSHTPGLWLMRLDEQIDGRTVLLRFDAGTVLETHHHEGGEEFFVLRGALRDEDGTYATHWWVRQPPGSAHSVVSDDGCLLFTTAGHLA